MADLLKKEMEYLIPMFITDRYPLVYSISSSDGETRDGFYDIKPRNSVTCGITQNLLLYHGIRRLFWRYAAYI